MVICKSLDEIQKMRAANGLVADVLTNLKNLVRPGITTKYLDEVAEKKIRDSGAIPAFKGYHGYPSTLCASINDAVVHGIPSKEELKEGDIVSLDVGVVMDGYYGDSAVTIGVGKISDSADLLLRITRESLERAISSVKVGGYVSDLGYAVQSHVEKHGFSVVREFVGHGIGTNLHEDPQIPNYGKPGYGTVLQSGMVLAIEPMVNIGKPEVQVLDDGWTAVTLDGGLSAHFEHSVAVLEDGPVVLSLPTEDNFSAQTRAS
tara:strand:+ start:1626 stop:2408 length:783 start_codon:yes stop_codon:yes gene_type:complete